MFRRLPEPGTAPVSVVPVTVDGHPFLALAGDSVAAVLLMSGRLACRSAPVSGAPRGPFCLIGACFDCLVTIDGQPNRQACLVPVAPAMRIETGKGAR
jgi:predicted molibdopterin-dependent oxidoreductase YjgC